jgi:integrase
MPKYIIDLLLDYVKEYKNESESFIFGRNKPFSETNIKRQLDKHIALSGVPHIVVYGFRHSHATNLIKQGVPIKVVSKRLGHSNTSTTMNVYWHLFNDDENQVLDVLEKM